MDRKSRLTRSAAAAAFALAALPAVAQPGAADLAKVAGAWDLALDGSHRKCRVMLALDQAGVGHALRFPAGCRRALPVLGAAGAWTMPQRGMVQFLDKHGEPTLQFREEGEDLIAHAPSGEVYHLGRQDKAVQPASLPVAPASPPLGVPQQTAIDPEKAPPFASVPGIYAVDRYTERDVCRVALTSTASANGRFEAALLDGCRDAGLLAFGPATWRYEGGRLTLTARRGHEVTLISERDGHWRRDPEVGATLVLRKTP